MSGLMRTFEGAYILCFCEGGAETAIINMLIDEKCLIFDREDLISNKVYPRMKAKDVEKKFLNRRYSKPVVILRIIDSKNEIFKLGKAYFKRYEVKTYLTKPEIEILIVLDSDMLDEFNKVKSNTKPSVFCKTELNYKNVKTKNFMKKYFDVEKLLAALKKYKSVSKNDHYTIYDLVKR